MTGNDYANIIDDFDVENNPDYQPRNRNTYCNIFAQDVAEACGTPLPTGGCTSMRNQLSGNQFPKWYSVTYQQAQAGATCYNDTTIAYGWRKSRHSEIRFYSWYETGRPDYGSN